MLDNKDVADECLKRILRLFLYDTIILLDCVLTDDLDDPQYSANAVWNRLSDYLMYQKIHLHKNYDVVDYLLKDGGYSQEEVELLMLKKEQEKGIM